jgi:5-methylcytosine-specific restriction endonuclease McrA
VNKCKQCNADTTNPKFCSRRCSTIFSNKNSPRRKRTNRCSCGNLILSNRKKCSECISKTKSDYLNMTLEEYYNRPFMINKHPSWRFDRVRQFAKQWFPELKKRSCSHCGYSKHVEICHIVPISKFEKSAKLSEVNSINNLLVLCPNCHWEFDNGLWLLS